jgi:hypothetical protein
MSELHSRPREPWDFSLSELLGEPEPNLTRAASSPDSRSCDLAFSMSVVVGPERPIVGRYISSFGAVPYEHLQALQRRNAQLLFADTIAAGLESDTASERRGRRLSADERFALRMDYNKASRTVAVYDAATDLLVFPTSYTSREPERPVFHETGHALTLYQASPREALLQDLPRELECYVREAVPRNASAEEQLKIATQEALAEGYVYCVRGRGHVLPRALREELSFILRTSLDGAALRYEI